MGAACCVAARDRTIQHGCSGEILHRNFRHSPSWSFRWDNRVGAAIEESSISGFSDVASRSDLLDLKSATDVSAHVSDGGSSLDNYQMGACHKAQLNPENNENLTASGSGHSIARNASLKVKQSTESPQVSDPASFKLKLSPSMHSSPLLSMSPPSAQSHQLAPSSPLSKWVRESPGNQLAQQALDSHGSGGNSPSMSSITEDTQNPCGIPRTSNDSTRVSYGRSSDGWSTHAFSQLMSASHRECPSFDSDSCRFSCDKFSRASGRNSGTNSMDFQACGICSKVLIEKSAWSTQKIIASNELSVVAVLACGHVYHAECLDVVTPEFNKYDPACPICTCGEKQTLKLSGKMLKAERDSKASRFSRKSRNQIGDTDESLDFDYRKSDSHEGRSPKLSTSSSLKVSAAKPFLRRHFSFGSRSSNSPSDSTSVRRKGLFWAKSTGQ